MDKERAARAPDIDDFLPSVSLDALFPEFSMSLVFLPAATIERARQQNGFLTEVAERASFALHSCI